jgi:sulfur carrier protein
MTTFEITLNGAPLATQAPTLQALLLARGYALQGAMACAINRSFVPRPEWPARALNNGDRIDVITPITGG